MIGVLSALPVISAANCCCAWILLGGALAAYLMQQGHPEPIGAGDGATVGLMAGVAGACIWLILSIPINAALAPFQDQVMQRALRQATDMAPEARAFLERLSAARGPATGLSLLFSFFVMMCISAVFGTFGGLFGALMFRKSAPPPPPPPSSPGWAPPPIPGDERH